MEQLDTQLRNRIDGAIKTVQRWDSDVDLLAAARRQIPWDTLRSDSCDDHPEDLALSPTARFVQRFARFFKQRMTWINQPPCQRCGQTETMESKGIRGPVTAEEVEGEAQRVEVYRCTTCGVETTFPRYNSVRKLLQTHAGRCGEYANLFGLYCRAAGLETRYVLDMTDHVWTEVRFMTDEVPCRSFLWLDSDEPWWCMIDSCEGVMDEPSMYEVGWGKQLSLIVAVSTNAVVDVTPKYTRKFHTPHFMARRRSFSSSEEALQRVIGNVNAALQGQLSVKGRQQNERCLSREILGLKHLTQLTEWDSRHHNYHLGRISGSLDWKASRHETGNSERSGEVGSETVPDSVQLLIEVFYPYKPQTESPGLEILVQPVTSASASCQHCHRGIVVNGVPCAIGSSDSLSVVVVDNVHLGCILNSRAFSSLNSLACFVETVPEHRIVVIVGRVPMISDSSASETVTEFADLPRTTKLLRCLGGFQEEYIYNEGVLFAGQVMVRPSWAYCSGYKDAPNGVVVQPAAVLPLAWKTNELALPDKCKLWTVGGIRPRSVAGRLRDRFMPLTKQIEATFELKRQAFKLFLQSDECCGYYGFTTKFGTPIYLLSETAYPFKRNSDGWHTCLLLPNELVPEDIVIDASIFEQTSQSTQLQFEIPLEIDFFTQRLGAQLLLDANTRISTIDTLRNSRLVGLYFSAHWCPRKYAVQI
jgi:peptide-N4-(N-acetyl-beta-glucosaminyl)asparagine amidase